VARALQNGRCSGQRLADLYILPWQWPHRPGIAFGGLNVASEEYGFVWGKSTGGARPPAAVAPAMRFRRIVKKDHRKMCCGIRRLIQSKAMSHVSNWYRDNCFPRSET